MITGKHSTVTPTIVHAKKFTGSPIDRASNRQIYKKHFHEVPLLKNLVKLCFLIFLLTWYGCCANLKKVTGFRGGTKTFF